jgi:hypothetical protein
LKENNKQGNFPSQPEVIWEMSGKLDDAMRQSSVAGLVLITLAVSAAAADMPNMVGAWTRIANTSAQIDKSASGPASTKPALTNGAGQDWKINIDAQDGRAFSGTLIDPTGQSYIFVGAFRDDKHFVFATDKDSGWGEIKENEMEYCWTAFNPSFVGAGCSRFTRSK